MNRSLLTCLLAVLGLATGRAQNYEVDALLFSTDDIVGTARFSGTAGAFASVGADATNGSYNPAGLGMYRRSAFTVTPDIVWSQVQSDYLQSTRDRGRTAFAFGNAAAVFNSPALTGGSERIRHGNIAVGVTRMNHFTVRERIEATNKFHSYADRWRQEIQVATGNQDAFFDFSNYDGSVSIDAVNAYQTFLVNWNDSLQTWTDPVNASIDQRVNTTTKGGKSEIYLGGGWNYMDRVYFGFSLGLPIIRYERELVAREVDVGDANTGDLYDFEEMTFTQTYETSGLGFNGRFGVIYAPVRHVRLAASVQTPSRISLSETYFSTIESRVIASGFGESWLFEPPNEAEFDYTLRTPWKGVLGASVIIKRSGFLSLDYEVTDFNAMRYDFGDEFATESDALNESMQNTYRMAHSIRLGGEYAVNRMRFRGGLGYTSSPFEQDVAVEGNDLSRWRMSGGLGFRGDRFFIDLAYSRTQWNRYQLLYALGGLAPDTPEAGAEQRRAMNHFTITLGFLR